MDTIKGQVESILQDYPCTRNNDGLLMLIWLNQQGIRLDSSDGGSIIAALNHLKTVWRDRQKFQQEGKYTANLEIQDYRRKKEEAYRIQYGSDPK